MFPEKGHSYHILGGPDIGGDTDDIDSLATNVVDIDLALIVKL